jgi:hypothetical protein
VAYKLVELFPGRSQCRSGRAQKPFVGIIFRNPTGFGVNGNHHLLESENGSLKKLFLCLLTSQRSMRNSVGSSDEMDPQNLVCGDLPLEKIYLDLFKHQILRGVDLVFHVIGIVNHAQIGAVIAHSEV